METFIIIAIIITVLIAYGIIKGSTDYPYDGDS